MESPKREQIKWVVEYLRQWAKEHDVSEEDREDLAHEFNA